MKKNLLLLSIALFSNTLLAQQEKVTPFWGKQEVYLNKQTEESFKLVNSLLSENPPSTKTPSLSRKSALNIMDQILHDTRLDGNEVLSTFMNGRLQDVLVDLRKPITKGIKVYKLYNDGFIVKSKKATVAFDMFRGPKIKNTTSSLISDEIMKELVDECDIMFLTHNHPDHVDPVVVNMFTDSGKEVVAVTEIQPNNNKITHVRSEEIITKKYKTGDSEVYVTILPGHQDELLNNIYIVTTPDGYTFAQTGDQYHKEDINWIKTLGNKIPKIDVLMINCWANSLYDTIEGLSPKVVLTGHENELGHTIDHRESYWTSYIKLGDIKRKNCLMTWGEMFSYK
jgi:L-ascorbate metabolism protein UlaG (beta-lactamase superfamily)